MVIHSDIPGSKVENLFDRTLCLKLCLYVVDTYIIYIIYILNTYFRSIKPPKDTEKLAAKEKNKIAMNDKPKIQVLTAGGAGRTPSSNRGKATKQAPTKTKSVSSSPAETESHASNIMKPLMSQNHPKGSSGSGDTTEGVGALEYEIPLDDDGDGDDVEDVALDDNNNSKNGKGRYSDHRKVTFASQLTTSVPPSSTKLGTSLTPSSTGGVSDVVWLIICFVGIMASFVCYGLLLEYTTSGGRKLHELSFLFITSALYTITAAAGRYVRDETPTTIPPRQFALLGLTSMGSTWCSVRSLRYVNIHY